MDMAQFVDEHQRAIDRQHRNGSEAERGPDILDQDRPDHRAVADDHASEHVGPVDAWIGLAEVLGQFARGAQHGLVVGDPAIGLSIGQGRARDVAHAALR